MTLEQIFEVLVGAKVFDQSSRQWRVYDSSGVELTSGPVLWRGVHGALLWARQSSAPWLQRARRRRR